MARLSQDRSEREAQLREYATDLRGDVETRTVNPPTEKIGVMEILVGIGILALAVWLVPILLGMVLGAIGWLVRTIINIAVIAAIGYGVWWMFFRRKRRY
ncbi:MAG TPA: hypothetical protein DCZ72_05665 [Armatimonadetes bacterium]|nr:hypothetical protein [Armatimonadota bacterium]